MASQNYTWNQTEVKDLYIYMNFKEWIEKTITVPIGNIWVMHWSVNPTNPKTLDWLRKNSNHETIEGHTGDHSSLDWYRLVDNVSDEGEITHNKNLPVDPKFPKVYIDNGTHRAVIMLERGFKEIPVKLDPIYSK